MRRHALIPLCNIKTHLVPLQQIQPHTTQFTAQPAVEMLVAFQPFNYANAKVLVHNAENISLFKPTWVKSTTPGSEKRMSFL